MFGTIIVPNGLLPSHLHEGIATFLETEMTILGGAAEVLDFSMFRRMAVEEGVWGNDFTSLDRLSGSPTQWPYGTSAYFFGYYLYEELWRQKGKKGIHDLTLGYSDNWPYFFINTPLRDVYGTDYPSLWQAIYSDSTKKVKEEIRQIKAQGLSDLHYLSDTRAGKYDLTPSPDGKRVASGSPPLKTAW